MKKVKFIIDTDTLLPHNASRVLGIGGEKLKAALARDFVSEINAIKADGELVITDADADHHAATDPIAARTASQVFSQRTIRYRTIVKVKTWTVGDGAAKPPATPPRPSLHRLMYLADFFSLGLRKRLKAMAGDYDVEIRALHAEKRYLTARWNKCLAWGHGCWYIFRGPFDWAVGLLVKAVTGK